MTEKRFTRDNHTGYLYDNGEIVEDIMELLNALNDENEQLKESVYSWSKSYNIVYEEKQSVIDWIDSKIREIKPYNSELCRATLLELKEFLE